MPEIEQQVSQSEFKVAILWQIPRLILWQIVPNEPQMEIAILARW